MNKRKFEAYEAIRQSGMTNMWAVDYVCKLSKAYAPDSQLTKKDCLDIMKNYASYKKTFDLGADEYLPVHPIHEGETKHE